MLLLWRLLRVVIGVIRRAGFLVRVATAWTAKGRLDKHSRKWRRCGYNYGVALLIATAAMGWRASLTTMLLSTQNLTHVILQELIVSEHARVHEVGRMRVMVVGMSAAHHL
jgi:hypothetical protein